MYQKFTVTNIEIDSATKEIEVNFTNDVDEDTVTTRSVFVSRNDDGAMVQTTMRVDGNIVYVNIKDELEPNTVYVICATTDITNILGTNLAHRIKKEFSIESQVRSTVKILTPCDYQEFMNSIKLTCKEIPDENDNIYGSYLVQVSNDTLFEKIILSTYLYEADFPVVLHGITESDQYYIRVRAQISDSDYGPWSPAKTFVLSIIDEEEEKKEDEPVFIRPLDILTEPEQGETPESFIIEFDGEIDAKTIEDNIILLHRRI